MKKLRAKPCFLAVVSLAFATPSSAETSDPLAQTGDIPQAVAAPAAVTVDPISIHAAADLLIGGSIRPTGSLVPGFFIYRDGTSNAPRPVISHSPAYPGYGLYYMDDGDRFQVQSSATDTTPSLVVDLDSNWVTVATPLPKPGYEVSVNGELVAAYLLVQDQTVWSQSIGFVSVSTTGVGVGVLEPTHPFEHASGARLTSGGAWTNGSDRALKRNFRSVDTRALLERVLALPLSEWSYREEGPAVRHVGPMAQDFHAAFGLGEDEKSIATVDADGVALAAIQGLNQKVEELHAENLGLKARLERLEGLLLERN